MHPFNLSKDEILKEIEDLEWTNVNPNAYEMLGLAVWENDFFSFYISFIGGDISLDTTLRLCTSLKIYSTFWWMWKRRLVTIVKDDLKEFLNYPKLLRNVAIRNFQ